MVENLTEMMQREWNSTNNDTNDFNGNPPRHSRLLTRKISDQNSINNHQQQQQQQQPLTNDFNEQPSTNVLRPPKIFSNRISLDAAYDTDGGIGRSGHSSRHHHHRHHHSSNNYEHLVSPRLPVRRTTMQEGKQPTTVPLQHRFSHKIPLNANPSLPSSHNYEERDEDYNYDSDARRRPIRSVHRTVRPSTLSANHGTRLNRPSILQHHGGPLVATPSVPPLRLIFMRHSERANQALGPDWYTKAFRTNTYRAYDPNLPKILPRRRFDQAYEYDAPLTVRGLNNAFFLGRVMLTHGLGVDICLSSTALRCVQTCERILSGMERRDRIPIRIEPGLFECPHLNYKIIESFMTKKELMENRYNIKHEYRNLVSKVTVPETLDEYFDRSTVVMRGIIDRYGPYGGTILIVTHAPGLLALTDAVKGLKPNIETFYRTVSAYAPLGMHVADYDGSKWKFSEQPFNLVSTGQ